MKKKLMVLCLALALVLSLGLTGCGSDALELNVYNHGEYIADGSDGLMDVVSEFESWYEETYGEKVKVNYTTFISNEDMYSKLSSGAVSYDVIFPSDYMVARLIDEGMLLVHLGLIEEDLLLQVLVFLFQFCCQVLQMVFLVYLLLQFSQLCSVVGHGRSFLIQ